MRLSPPELSFLYTSLTSNPPIRPDLRSLTQYRPYSIQTDFLPTANGSARITWGAGREGGDVLVVIKAQIDTTVELSKGVYGGQLSVDICNNNGGSDGDEDSTAFLKQSLTSLLIPRQSSSYGIDLRSLVITETKAWHVWIDCVILSSDIPLPLDALSLAVRIALQTTLLPHITIEDIPSERTYEERAALMDLDKGRVPHEEKVFQVDDDWDNAVPLISKKDWWKIPVIVTANIVEKTIFFDASPREILVTANRYAIATLPLNSILEKRKVVFCESVGLTDGYAAAGRGVEPSELQRMISEAMKVGKETIEVGDAEVEQISR